MTVEQRIMSVVTRLDMFIVNHAVELYIAIIFVFGLIGFICLMISFGEDKKVDKR